jgi:hypothetical protein
MGEVMQRQNMIVSLIGAAGLATAAAAQPQVIITEIYSTTNQAPGQNERVQEFIEITNVGDAAQDVGGWFVTDDGTTEPIDMGVMLMPGQSLVLFGTQNATPDPVNTNGDRVTPEVFAAQWADAGTVAAEYLTPFESLSNSPNSVSNEVLTLFDAGGNPVDIVNYDDVLPWPSDIPDGSSIVLLPEFTDPATLALLGVSSAAEANDNGLAWRRADLIVDGARKTDGTVNTREVYYDDVELQQNNTIVVVDPLDPNAVLITPTTNVASPGFFDATPDMNDCNNNGLDDDVEIYLGALLDLDQNGVPDNCEGVDCNGNGVNDVFEILQDPANTDADLNGEPDECQINAAGGVNGVGGTLDANSNGRLDAAEVGDLIISELMFNPAGPEGEGEWLEVYNAGTTSVDLTGWGFLKTEPGTDDFGLENVSDPIAAADAVTLAPGEAAVFINDYNNPGDGDPSDIPGADMTDPIEEFRTGWGLDASVKIVAISDWGFLANNASNPGNEVPTLYAPPNLGAAQPGGVAPALVLVDSVDYDADLTPFPFDPGAEWPGDDGTWSYYLRPDSLNNVANNRGSNWGGSIDGLNGAYSTNGLSIIHDSIRTTGSPGFVQTGTEELDGSGEVIITEIYSAPNSAEIDTGLTNLAGDPVFAQAQNEWVEIHNTTSGQIDISGWYLRDEDGFTEPFPAGTVLEAGETAVVFGMDRTLDIDGEDVLFEYGSRQEAQQAFYDAWQCGYQVIAIRGWGFDRDFFGFDSNSINQLSNSPNRANEVLTLRKADGALVDIVNFEDIGGLGDTGIWPNDATGLPDAPNFSIFLGGSALDNISNNDGSNWFPTIVSSGVPAEARNNLVTDFFTVDPMTVTALMESSAGIVPGGTPLDLADCPDLPCNAADLAEPFGELTFGDIGAFLGAFDSQDPAADLAAPFGDFTFGDIGAFINAFNNGCP